jgi:hypothetical protein
MEDMLEGNKRRCCTKPKELLLLQFEALKKEEMARRQIYERKTLSEEELNAAAKGRMLRPSFSSYASGFKAVYCNIFCQVGCDNPYDKDSSPENERYDLINIREKMKEIGLLHIYSMIEPELRVEVGRNKYYRSKETGRDIGWKAAEIDYIDRGFLKNFIEGASTCFVEIGLQQKSKLEKLLAT